MPKSLSSVVRLTVPISAELSERISVLAWYSDLTRSQYLRRTLHDYVANAIAEWARLADLSPEHWYAEALARYQCRHELVTAAVPIYDAAAFQPGLTEGA